MAAYPELSPAQNHLLRTASVIQNVHYLPNKISYTTYDKTSHEVLRMSKKPTKVSINGVTITDKSNKLGDVWVWKALKKGGVLEVIHTSGNKVVIDF